MKRQVPYYGALVRALDPLLAGQNAMEGLGKLAEAVFGSSQLVYGFTLTPTSPASMSVNLGPGQIYELTQVESSSISLLNPDTHPLVKQGILRDAVQLALVAPTTPGYAQNYLVEAKYADADTGNTVLNYYNAANPSVPLVGPGGNGQAQSTQRDGTVAYQLKAGTAATSGTQTTPSPDAGWAPLFVVTVAYGATSITSGNISQHPSAPFPQAQLSNLKSLLQTSVPGSLIKFVAFTSSGTYTPSPGTQFIVAEGVGGGGAGAGGTNPSAGNLSIGAPGGAGAYGRGLFTIAQIGSSQTVTIGAGGAGVAGASGNSGGSTSLGSLLVLPGGVGGGTFNNQAPPAFNGNGNTTSNPTGANIFGRPGGVSSFSQAVTTGYGVAGQGGDSPFGTGGYGVTTNVNGTTGVGKGSGGSGAVVSAGNGTVTGGTGSAGLLLIAEYGAL